MAVEVAIRTMNFQSDFLKPAEAGKYLGDLKESTLAAWRSSGRNELPYFKIGGKVRYRKSDLDRWLNSHRVGHPLEVA